MTVRKGCAELKEIRLQIYESGWTEPVGRGIGAQREMILPQDNIGRNG
jgi:hypothetical protein